MIAKNKFNEIRYFLTWKFSFGKKRKHYKQKYKNIVQLNFLSDVCQKNIEKLKNKLRKKIQKTQKISVYFVAYEKAQWGLGSVFEAMKNDPVFEPKVFVCRAWERENVEANPTQDLIEFFEKQNMEVVLELDENQLPDVIFSARYDFDYIKFNYDIKKLYKKSLLCYFSYPWIVEGQEKRVYDVFYNANEMKFFWKEFMPDINSFESTKNGPTKGKNVILSGHPKGDEIYRVDKKCEHWKNNDTKKIIYAPHWSIYNSIYAKSCFERYYVNFLNYLTEHPEIEIILKPHPMLRKLIYDKDIQKTWNATPNITPEEYEEFINKWCNLPNANIVDDGNYFNLFATSDAMILDSLSFTAEYMLLNKPMCWCSKQDTEEEFRKYFNRMGNDLLNAIEIAFSWEDIVSFIEETVVKGNDRNDNLRLEMIDKHLSVNKGQVGEFIKNHIKEELIYKEE